MTAGLGQCNNPEKYFDRYEITFDFGNGVEDYVYVGHGYFRWHGAFIKPHELPTWVKLTYCLMQRPGDYFMAPPDLPEHLYEKLLVLPRGNLVVPEGLTFKYPFKVDCQNIIGTHFDDSTSLMLGLRFKIV